MSDFALLAPVPIGLLEASGVVEEHEGKVAFGSNAWELFRKLDDLRGAEVIDVFIYASRNDEPSDLDATWTGRYVGHKESRGGAHPDGRRYRPDSTRAEDKTGHWAVFWEVVNLRRLPTPIPVADFVGYRKQRQYRTNFVPEGPVIVHQPPAAV